MWSAATAAGAQSLLWGRFLRSARGQLVVGLHAFPYLPSVLGTCWADKQRVMEKEEPSSRRLLQAVAGAPCDWWLSGSR